MAQANQPTRRFGDFEIIERLGRGGFGTVYKARETTLGRIVALKVLNHAFANDPDWVRRFQREASIAANLNHTIIPVIYRFGDVNGRYFISMAFVPGVNLAQVSRHGGPMAVDRMVALLTPVAEALDYAHGQGGGAPRPEAGKHHGLTGRHGGTDGLWAGIGDRSRRDGG